MNNMITAHKRLYYLITTTELKNEMGHIIFEAKLEKKSIFEICCFQKRLKICMAYTIVREVAFKKQNDWDRDVLRHQFAREG
jgi:hypothetical protein